MKKILLGIFFLCSVGLSAQNSGETVVYLNNGNVVRGQIIDTGSNTLIKIKADNGAVYEYKKTEIRDIKAGDVITPEESSRRKYVDYEDNDKGFWWAAELSGGPSVFYEKANLGHTQLAIVGGYRFNDFIRAGIGLGARYYIDNKKVRAKSNAWSFPIYANLRGNFMPQDVRRVVPYWSVDVGGTIRDGFFFSPTLGVRFGGKRSNMLVGISYTGQTMDTKWESDKMVSLLSAKIGYEF